MQNACIKMKTAKYLILLLFLLFASALQAQVSEYEHKAAFIERFTRFIEWPEAAKTGSSDQFFEITVLGRNVFNGTLDALFSDLKVKNRQVKIKYTRSFNEIDSPDLLFICFSERNELAEINKKLRGKPTLIISDSKGFAEMGVHINIYLDDSYLRYEINQEMLELSGLKASSLLLASAKIVRSKK